MFSSLIDEKDEEIAELKARIKQLESELKPYRDMEERIFERIKQALQEES